MKFIFQLMRYFYLVEGKSRVLGHWACYKVETSTADEDETARQVNKNHFYTRKLYY